MILYYYLSFTVNFHILVLTTSNFSLIVLKVHCVYGQSRSAAVVISYLLSTGMNIHEAIKLLKESRPIICINPGFLAQLYLLSLKGYRSPDFNIIVRSPFDLISKIGESEDTEPLPKLRKLNYSDCYKNVSAEAASNASVDISLEGVINGDKAICEGHDNVEVVDAKPLSDIITIEEEKSKVYLCGNCRRVLADEVDRVFSIDYTHFLRLYTDEYWIGYKAIHPRNLDLIVLEKNCDKTADKGTSLDEKHSRKNKGNASHSDQGKSAGRYTKKNYSNNKSAPATEDILILGPLDWIVSQIKVAMNRTEKLGKETPKIRDHSHSGKIVLSCPKCDVECGYCAKDGLEICSSFLRCSLIALKSSSVTVSVLNKST